MADPNPWDSDPIVTPTAAPGFTGVIPGVPKPPAPKTTYRTLSPEEAKARNLNPDATYEISSEGDIKSISKLPNQNDTEAKTQSAMDSTRDLIQSIERARGLVSNWSTGLGGAVGKLYPGSDQANQLDTIVHQELRGNIFKNWVAQLKAQSATGTSGIGRIMQSEIPLVTGSLGALDPVKMGRQGTLDSFDQIENRVLRSAALLNNENPDDPKVLQKYRDQFIPHAAIPPSSGGGGGGGSGSGGDTPPGMSDLTPDQKQAYSAFLAVNPNPTGDQVGGFLSKLTGKQVTNGDDIAKAIAHGSGVSTTVQDLTEQQKVKDRIAEENKLGLNDNAVTTLVKHGATLNLSDEAAGVGNAAANVITSPFTGKFDPVGSYDLGRDVERQRISDARQQLGYAAPVAEFAGGMAAAAPTSALAAVTDLPALVRQGAKGGATGGALAGFGSGEGTSQSLTGAAVGGSGGAAVGALAPYAVNRVIAARAPQAMAPDLANAAQAEGVDLVRPMVDPASRGKFGSLESAPGSQNVIRDAVANTKGQIESRVADLGAGGMPLEPGAAGERLQLASNRFIERSRGIKDRLYRAAENAAGDARFVPKAAIDQLNADIEQLSANPKSNAATIQFLQDKVSDLSTPGGKTVAEIRNIREGLRGEISTKNLTMTNAERLANNALHAAGDDIAQANPQAGRLYKRADTFYAGRQTVVDDIKRAILGGKNDPLDPQKAFANIRTLAAPGGNLRRLSAVTRYLEPDERQDIAATVAAALGRDAPDMPFSSDKFITQTNKLSPQARKTIFGPDGAQSIDNLRLLSQSLKEGVGDINRSRTANSMLRQMAGRFVASLTGLGGAAGLMEGGVAGGGTGLATGLLVGAGVKGAQMARNILSARAMVNPRVTMWLAQTAKVSTPSQAQQAVKGLSLVISREPALAHELTPIRDFLDQRVAQLLAAEPAAPDQKDNQQR